MLTNIGLINPTTLSTYVDDLYNTILCYPCFYSVIFYRRELLAILLAISGKVVNVKWKLPESVDILFPLVDDAKLSDYLWI